MLGSVVAAAAATGGNAECLKAGIVFSTALECKASHPGRKIISRYLAGFCGTDRSLVPRSEEVIWIPSVPV